MKVLFMSIVLILSSEARSYSLSFKLNLNYKHSVKDYTLTCDSEEEYKKMSIEFERKKHDSKSGKHIDSDVKCGDDLFIGAFHQKPSPLVGEIQKPQIRIYEKPDLKSKLLSEYRYFSHEFIFDLKYKDKLSKKDARHMKSFSYNYEGTAFSVFEKKADWVKVAIEFPEKKYGWVKLEKSYTYLPLEALLKDRLYRTTDTFDGSYYKTLNLKELKSTEDLLVEESLGFKVVDQKFIGGKLYYHVQFVEGQCIGKEKKLGSGWMPVINKKNSLNIWFYSKGC